MKRIITCTLILLSFYTNAQKIFSNVREGLLVGSFRHSLTQLDSCIAKGYQKDSAIYYKGLVYYKINNLKEATNNCGLLFKTYSYIACAWATLAAYSSMMILSYILGQKYFPIKYNVRAISVYVIIALGFYFISFTYSDMESTIIKLILNNLFVILFAWFVYKLEFSNLKKLRANGNTTN